MRRKNIYKSKLGTERATAQRYCQCSLPSRAERHYSGLNVARDMQLVATDDGNSRDDLTADLGFVLPWPLMWLYLDINWARGSFFKIEI